MIVLDTTVLVYAKGADHPLREPCRELLAAVGDGRIVATTTIEVIQEFAHVRARRRGRSDAASVAEDYAELLAPLLPVTHDDLRAGLALFAQVERIGAFDAVLAAAAIGSAKILVSADTAFAAVPRLAHIVPSAAAVRDLCAHDAH